MDYHFTMLTISQPITTKSSGAEAQAPWTNVSRPIALPDARLQTVTISDDDGNFQSGRYHPDPTGQALTTAVTFGNASLPTPAGTRLSWHIASIIQSIPAVPGGPYDEFLAVFPRQLVPNAIGGELGGRYSVLLLPVARPDGTLPVFDLAKSYRYAGLRNLTSVIDSVAYPVDITCFAAGTMILTATGPQSVESLKRGDLIVTRDHGLQALRWTGGSHVSRDGLELRPNLRPILIRKDALGAGSPAHDLTVSPQHRILVRSRIAHRLFEDNEILVAAKHLIGLPGIEVIAPAAGVTYFHLLFDRHEIVMSNGAWSESLYTGPQALQAISDAARRELLALFPELGEGAAPEPARRLLTGREAQQLTGRQLRNIGRRRLVEPV